MTTSKEILSEAYKLGVNAFLTGTPRIPCQDNAIMDIMKGNTGFVDSIALIDKWNNGWDVTNLAQALQKPLVAAAPTLAQTANALVNIWCLGQMDNVVGAVKGNKPLRFMVYYMLCLRNKMDAKLFIAKTLQRTTTMTSFIKLKFPTATNQGTVWVDGCVSNYFGIYKTGKTYSITHLLTGRVIGYKPLLKIAKHTIIALEELEVDWNTMNNDNIRNHPLIEKIKTILA